MASDIMISMANRDISVSHNFILRWIRYSFLLLSWALSTTVKIGWSHRSLLGTSTKGVAGAFGVTMWLSWRLLAAPVSPMPASVAYDGHVCYLTHCSYLVRLLGYNATCTAPGLEVWYFNQSRHTVFSNTNTYGYRYTHRGSTVLTLVDFQMACTLHLFAALHSSLI